MFNSLAYKLTRVKCVHEHARKTPAVSRVRRQHDLPKMPFEYVRVCLDEDLFGGRLCRSLPHGGREAFPVKEAVYSDCNVSRISSAAGFRSPRLAEPGRGSAGVSLTCRWTREPTGLVRPAQVAAGPVVASACCTARAGSSQLRPIRGSARRCRPDRTRCASAQAPAGLGLA